MYQVVKNSINGKFTFTTSHFSTELFSLVFILRQSIALTSVIFNQEVKFGKNTKCNIQNVLHE